MKKAFFSWLAITAVSAVSITLSPAHAQGAIEADAADVLERVASHLASLTTFSVDYDIEAEVVSYEGQKLQFVSSGGIEVQRPNKMRASRKGAVVDLELILDGSVLSLHGKNIGAFFQLPAASIEQAIHALSNDVGFDMPGSDLLSENAFQEAGTDTTSGTHIGMTFIDNVPVHHLAFRGTNVDWQLWVTEGEKPFPVKYVITSKWVAASPEYSITLKNWETAPAIDPARFIFSPPTDARKLETLMLDALGEVSFERK